MTADHKPRMTVGELSWRTGVSVKNLREYADTGLVYTVGRSPAGYRLFDTDALWCLEWVDRLRGLGLTLAEIRKLTTTYFSADGRDFASHLAELLDRSRDRTRRRIAEQQRVLGRIETFVADHRADLAGDGELFSDDPRRGASASVA